MQNGVVIVRQLNIRRNKFSSVQFSTLLFLCYFRCALEIINHMVNQISDFKIYKALETATFRYGGIECFSHLSV